MGGRAVARKQGKWKGEAVAWGREERRVALRAGEVLREAREGGALRVVRVGEVLQEAGVGRALGAVRPQGEGAARKAGKGGGSTAQYL